MFKGSRSNGFCDERINLTSPVSSRRRVRDFDQLFGALRSIVELARRPTAAESNLRAVRSVGLMGGMTRCIAGSERAVHWRRHWL
jgi:hypothetical protein